MIDLFHNITLPGIGTMGSNPNYDFQVYVGQTQTTLLQYHTWRKPRGCKMVYMIAVGGGSSGSIGTNTAATGGGGAGGGSGAQSILVIPSFFLPDELFVQAGWGGIPGTLSGTNNSAGTPSYVVLEPATSLTAQLTVLFANGGPIGSANPTTTTGGTATLTAAAATITNMCYAGRGFYNFLAGVGGRAGGSSTPTAGANITLPTTGLIVTGGAGGGGSTTTGGAGGGVTGVGFGENFPSIASPAAASGATPAQSGSSGLFIPWRTLYGGTGGGGATTTAGGNAGAGGDGAPGCGGGGNGASNTTNPTLAAGGTGGPGFVIIISW